MADLELPFDFELDDIVRAISLFAHAAISDVYTRANKRKAACVLVIVIDIHLQVLEAQMDGGSLPSLKRK